MLVPIEAFREHGGGLIPRVDGLALDVFEGLSFTNEMVSCIRHHMASNFHASRANRQDDESVLNLTFDPPQRVVDHIRPCNPHVLARLARSSKGSVILVPDHMVSTTSARTDTCLTSSNFAHFTF